MAIPCNTRTFAPCCPACTQGGHGHGGHGHGGGGKKLKAIPIPDIKEVETHYRDYLPLFTTSLTYLHGKGQHISRAVIKQDQHHMHSSSVGVFIFGSKGNISNSTSTCSW